MRILAVIVARWYDGINNSTTCRERVVETKAARREVRLETRRLQAEAAASRGGGKSSQNI